MAYIIALQEKISHGSKSVPALLDAAQELPIIDDNEVIHSFVSMYMLHPFSPYSWPGRYLAKRL